MGPLVFCQLGGRRNNMCKLNVNYNGSSLSSGDIELQGGYMSLILIKRTYIGILVGAGIGNISKFPTV
jgi:hypothetical protein